MLKSFNLARFTLLSIACGLSSPVVAATLDFNAASYVMYATAPYNEDGFRISVLTNHYDIWYPDGYCPPDATVCHTTNYLGVDDGFDGAGASVRLTQANGENFDLLSLYVYGAAPGEAGCPACPRLLSSAGGSALFVPLTTMTFDGPEWTNVAWIDIVAGSPLQNIFRGSVALDDIVVTPSTVPVPAAAWLLGSALGVLGWMKRKNYQAVA